MTALTGRRSRSRSSWVSTPAQADLLCTVLCDGARGGHVRVPVSALLAGFTFGVASDGRWIFNMTSLSDSSVRVRRADEVRGVPRFPYLNSGGWFHKKIVQPISEASFGMYLLHMFILTPMSGLFRLHLPTPLAILATAAATFACSALAALILRRIPVLGKYLCG